MHAPQPVGAGHAYAPLVKIMAAIHASAFPPAEIWSEDAIASLLATPGVQAWIQQDGGMILSRLVVDEAEILTLAVAPQARRRGVARALLSTAIAALRAQGVQSLFLEVSDGNGPAHTLYLATGFQPAGMRRCYYADGSNALLLKLSLSG